LTGSRVTGRTEAGGVLLSLQPEKGSIGEQTSTTKGSWKKRRGQRPSRV